MSDWLLILGAVLLAGMGGEAFLKAILSASHHLHLPKGVVATTLAAFATSSPELTVSTIAALAGAPQIGLGDALGSNVVNIALIFGLALLYGAVQTTRQEFGRDFYLALAVPSLTLAFMANGRLESYEALLLLMIFFVWLAGTLRRSLQCRTTNDAVGLAELSIPATLLFGMLGLAALISAGRLFVSGASGIAESFSVDSYVIGVVLVAIGTSLPELVTVILSRVRGHDDVGVGTLLGSNIFNGLAIVGVAGTIHPISAPFDEVALTLACGAVSLLLLLPDTQGLIRRPRGLALLLVYIGFVWATLAS